MLGLAFRRDYNNGHLTRYDYNRAGRLTARHLPATDSAPAQTEAFTWSPDGELLSAANPTQGIRIERHYNKLGQLSLEAQHLGNDWTWQASRQYDERGRREQSLLGDAPPINWLSYGPGHLMAVSSGPMAVHFARNALHQETQRELYSRHAGDQQLIHQQQRQYDTLGRLEQSQLKPSPGSPSALHWERRYQYDAQDQLEQLQDNRHGRIGYQYDPSGRLIGSLHQQSEQSKQTQQYRYDAAGNRLDHGPHAGAQPEDWAAKVAANLYNPAFNLLGEEESEPAPTAACWPDNRILSLDQEEYSYDGVGNLTERLSPDGSRLKLGYDGAHRVIQLERKKANGEHWLAEYRYDPLGRRIAKQVNYTDASGQTYEPQTICFGWDGDQQSAEAWQDDKGQWQVRTTLYEPGSFVPLLRMVQIQPQTDPVLLQLKRQLANAGEPMPEELRQALTEGASECAYASFHTDHLGTPMALTNAEGKLLWEASPDDWAAVRNENGRTEQPLRFQGQYEDEESGLYYNRHRYYDPQLGRYVNQDPIGLMGGPNTYAYPFAPTEWVDPLGLTGTYGLGGGPWSQHQQVQRSAKATSVQAPVSSRAKEVAVTGIESNWEFVDWAVLEPEGTLLKLWTDYKDVTALCEDQHGNRRSVAVKYFQTRPACFNEVCRAGGPNPSTDVIDALFNVSEAVSQAKSCGSLSNFECFMLNDATPELGAKKCSEL